MRTPIAFALLLTLCAAPLAQAQPQPVDWQVVERGAHHNVHERTEVIDLGGGRTETHTRTYTEIATGLNRLGGANGDEWIEARAEFEILPGGYAIANQTQHRLLVSPTINDANGVIDFLGPDGQRIRSGLMGLALRDRVTGASLLVAEIVPTPGRLVAPNQILFADCFDDVHADVRLTVERSGYHQDVVIRERFDPAWLEQNGFSKETTRIEIWTEVFEAPQPIIDQRVLDTVEDASLRRLMSEPDVLEHTLDWGVMKMPLGRAYAEGGPRGPGRSVAVPKRWVQTGGRTFLVESISLVELEPLMAGLPPRTGPSPAKPVFQAGVVPVSPELSSPGTNRILTAQLDPKPTRPGVIWDYATVNGSLTNLVLDGTTYVSGPVAAYGNFTINGGSVTKFNPATSGQIQVHADNVYCLTDQYRPAVFTSMNDNTAGEVVSTSTGSPSIDSSTEYLHFHDCVVELHDLRMHYSYDPLVAFGGSLALRDSQFVQNEYPFWFEDTAPCVVQNVLVDHSASEVFWTEGVHVQAEHLTIHNAYSLGYAGSESTMGLTNCLLVDMDSWGDFEPTSNAVHRLASSAGVFQSVGAGNFYLAANSPYRNAGTTSITPALLTNLWKQTTYPPLVISNLTVSTNLTLSAQAQRDTDQPDVGFHYSPLDYLISWITVMDARLTFTEGTTVAWHGSKGFTLDDGGELTFDGSAILRNQLCCYQAVQEQPMFLGTHPIWMNVVWAEAWEPAATLAARFTDMHRMAGENPQIQGFTLALDVRHCYVNLYRLQSYTPYNPYRVDVINNVFDRTSLDFSSFDWICPLTFHNNLVLSSGVYFDRSMEGYSWVARDNLFVGAGISWSGVTHSHNGYRNTSVPSGSDGSDVSPITALEFATGPLGDYYLESSTPTLVDEGSRDADEAGLYHYTIETGQTKEGGSVVDIGVHYVAVDEDGLPFDSDNDGIPDYLEDANGDGDVDSGETDWDDENDLGLRVVITEPKRGANLP